MLSYQSNVKALKKKRTNVLRLILLGVLLPLLPLAFLLDLVWFFVANYEGCLNCGYKEVLTKGLFCRSIIKLLKPNG